MDEKPQGVDDSYSHQGKFGWTVIEGLFLPYIFRGPSLEKLVPVRVAYECLYKNLLDELPSDVCRCYRHKASTMTSSEKTLVNEINSVHSNFSFGQQAFTESDNLDSLDNVVEFFQFLVMCHRKLVSKIVQPFERCGFVRINGLDIFPYVRCSNEDGEVALPRFFFPDIESRILVIKGWDLIYLRLCLLVQGVVERDWPSESCEMIALEAVKASFPMGTIFHEHLPEVNSSLLPSSSSKCPRFSSSGMMPSPVARSSTSSASSGSKVAQSTSSRLATESVTSTKSSASWRSSEVIPLSVTAPQVKSKTNPAATMPKETSDKASTELSSPTKQPPTPPTLTSSNGQDEALNIRQSDTPSAIKNDINLNDESPETFKLEHEAVGNENEPSAILSLREIDDDSLRSSGQENVPPIVQNSTSFTGRLEDVPEVLVANYILAPKILERVTCTCIQKVDDPKSLMLTLPDYAAVILPSMGEVDRSYVVAEKLEHLKVKIFKGNRRQNVTLQRSGKCNVFNPVPLLYLHDAFKVMWKVKGMVSQEQRRSSSSSQSTRSSRTPSLDSSSSPKRPRRH